MLDTLEPICFVVGLIAIVKVLFRLIKPVFHFQHDLLKRYGGGWAVVTGGTDGIGLGYCEELAKLGFNLCIISRSLEKLERVREDLRSLNPQIEVKIIRADFGRSLQDGFFEPIFKELDQLDVSVLVNNVGILNHSRYAKLEGS